MDTEDYPYADSQATQMLATAIERYTAVRPGGLRALAATLGLKQAVVLSHMANGRMAIPLERAEGLASVLDLPPIEFAAAVLHQRAPGVAAMLGLDRELQRRQRLDGIRRAILEAVERADNVSEQHVGVIREILRHAAETARYVAGDEGRVVDAIRRSFPEGIDDNHLAQIIECIERQ